MSLNNGAGGNDEEMPPVVNAGAEEGRDEGDGVPPNHGNGETNGNNDDSSSISSDSESEDELFEDIYDPNDPNSLNGMLITDSDVEDPSEVILEHLFWVAEHELKMAPVYEEHRWLVLQSQLQDELLRHEQQLLSEVQRAVEDKEQELSELRQQLGFAEDNNVYEP